MKNIGVILAGGSGRRLGSELPKQFIVIAGKTVLAHTLHIFEKHERIDEIIIVIIIKIDNILFKILSPFSHSIIKRNYFQYKF